ncbi:MAG: primosomal protein N' [Neisseria sp.]|nr:primosomal protein N' [Neisseria sp.]
MYYHRIALNVPVSDGLFTYSHPDPLPPGTRVTVSFRRKTLSGIVWENHTAPGLDPAKILPVQTVFGSEPPLPEEWRALLAFASRYYHYPLGQVVAAALPQGLKGLTAAALPVPPRFYRLSEEGLRQPPPRFPKQAALWQALHTDGTDTETLKHIHKQAAELLDEWAKQGWVETCGRPCGIAPPPHAPNPAQLAAARAVRHAFGGFQSFLLYGITGSGKTEAYFEIMADILARGGQVLFLLPEINLTPQLLERVERRFPQVPAAVLHSQTPAGRRTRDYLRAQTGQAKLIIGTRLAVFTPLPDLGLIVVDEEHDNSFKQDNELRYQARDLAVWRAKQRACPIVLGSATPSLESWHKAKSGAYRLLELPARARPNAVLPHIDILDIKNIKLDNGFSPQALTLLQQNHRAGGLSMVYINRRGFAPALFCGDCGHTLGCPNCSAKMVLHRQAGQLRCHHCDYRQPVPHQCPECGNQDLTAVGQGTQRVEETLRRFLPQAGIARVDRDSTSRKNDWAKLYAQINGGGLDILVGTQMLAKGHDFARLNLIVILDADGSLYSADFRAPERLFSELMQVSGRAGRAEKPGRVLIQTRLPQSPLYAALKAQDYRRFADKELQERADFALPPFAFQIAIRADAPHMSEAEGFLNQIKEAVQPLHPEGVTVFGAVPMFMMRLAERERAQIFLESPSRADVHRAAALWLQMLRQNRNGNIRWSVDVDPQEI